MLFKNKNSIKTAYKWFFFKSFFEADAKTAYGVALLKTDFTILPSEVKNNQEKIEKMRYDFIYGGTKIGMVTFDNFFDLIMGDRFNNSLLTKSFGERDKIKQFIDFYLIDSFLSVKVHKMQQADVGERYIPVGYLIFFVEDTSYLQKIVNYYIERNMKSDSKEIDVLLQDFYNNYCKTSRFSLSDYFFDKL